MIEFLSSPVLFPSDLDDSSLLADPTFKLPASVNWVDYTYFTMMTDRLAPHMTDIVSESRTSLDDDAKSATTAIVLLETTVDDNPHFHSYPGATTSKLNQYIPFALHLQGNGLNRTSGLHHDDIDHKQCNLPVMVYGVLDATEKDSQQKANNPHLSMHHGKDDENIYPWLFCADTMGTPDLVYSPPSPRSLASDDSHEPLVEDVTSHRNHNWVK